MENLATAPLQNFTELPGIVDEISDEELEKIADEFTYITNRPQPPFVLAYYAVSPMVFLR
jgi:hypothetical protein